MASYSELRGGVVYDSNDEKIGTVDDFYLDDTTDQPTWITVRTGLFGNRVNFVPLAGSKETEDGLRVAFTKDQVKSAPNAEADEELEESEESELYSYYRGLIDQGASDITTNRGSEGQDRSQDTGRTSTREEMTRSEEEVQVRKQPVETGRVRLKKYVVTEHVNFTVPVQREKVRLVRESITDANAATDHDGPELSEEEREVALHEEQVSVDKNVVPKERVRLEKDTEQGERQVDETVRKEQVDIEDDDKK